MELALSDDSVYLHGPFDFATFNGRHTNDCISRTDWKYLVAAKPKYDNAAPNVEAYVGYTFCFNNNITQSIPSTPDMVARVCNEAYIAHVNVLMLNRHS